MSDKAAIGSSGASGKGWSELKDIECELRYTFIKEAEAANVGQPRIPTKHDEAFQNGIFMHAARAYWLVNGQGDSRSLIEECCSAGKADCIKQNMPTTEIQHLEYSLQFLNFARYWAVRPKIKTVATELYLEYDFVPFQPLTGKTKTYLRTTRLDDLSYYPDVDGLCIGEFKTTYSLAGALKYYSEFNPQILLQQAIYAYTKRDSKYEEIKGTMVDIWDKGKNKGTRHFVPINTHRLKQFSMWVERTLELRYHLLAKDKRPERNYLVCNTFNDAYNSQCAWKEQCAAYDD